VAGPAGYVGEAAHGAGNEPAHGAGDVPAHVLAAAGIAVAAYVLYHKLWPVPPSPFDVFPYIVAAWLAIGAVISRLI
jgi:hypothetical protein